MYDITTLVWSAYVRLGKLKAWFIMFLHLIP